MTNKLHIADQLSLPIEAVTQTFAVLAKRGVGKTYTGAVMVEEMLDLEQQVVVADPVGVWWGLRSSADGKQPGFKIVVFGGEHADLPIEEHAGEIVAQSIVENGFSAVLDLSLFRKGQQIRFMTAFAETLYRLNRKPLHFVVDEADAFAPQRPMGEEARLLGAFEDIVRRGRARGLGVTLITQRAAVINKNVLTQIEVLVALRTISPQDREALKAWVEVHGSDRKQDEFWNSLASLPIGEAWFWSPGWLDIFKRVQVRRRKTFDSSATPKVGEKVQKPKALAEIDLEELGAQIKATAEKVKENDPAQLKRAIAELRRENDRLKKQTPASRKMERVEVPVLDPETVKRIRDLWEHRGEMYRHLIASGDVMRSVFNALEKFERRATRAEAKTASSSRPTAPIPPRPAPVQRRATNGDSSSIAAGLRRMLTALAQRSPLNRKQLGVRAGMSSRSGTFDTYLSRARSNRWVVGSGDNLHITDDGRQALGAYDPLPEGQELLGYWLTELGASGAGRMLRVLADRYPQTLSRQELGALAEMSDRSGTFDTYLSRLRTLELVDGRGDALSASKEFFE